MIIKATSTRPADPDVTLDDLREAVNYNEGTVRTARRVLGGTHPLVVELEETLRYSRGALSAGETSPPTDK